jgi:hypothetical protein
LSARSKARTLFGTQPKNTLIGWKCSTSTKRNPSGPLLSFQLYRRHGNSFLIEKLQDAIKAIREAIQKEQETIEAFPDYRELLRDGLAPSQVAKYHLDYRTAGKLANLITELHFKLQDGLEQEYKEDLREHAPLESPEEILARMSRRLKSIRWQKSRG